MHDLNVEARHDGDRLVLRCRGELDHFTAPAVRRAVTDAHRSGWRRIVVDLSELGFMDSGGVHLLEDLRDGRLGSAEFTMVDGHPAVRLPVQLTHGAPLLPSARR